MPDQRTPTVVIGDESFRSLHELISSLNGGPTANAKLDAAAHAALLRWVTAWQKSGPNLKKMCAGDLDLDSALRLMKSRVRYLPTTSGKARLELLLDPLAVEYLLAESTASIGWPPGKGAEYRCRMQAIRAEQEALRLFVSLTVNEEWAKLGGPCARCHKFYSKKRASQKVYCSRTCGNASTALARTQEQRKKTHESNLQRARTASRRWHPTTTDDWKQFISRETGLSVKWITRAFNRGELRPVGPPLTALERRLHNPQKLRRRRRALNDHR